MTLSQGLHQVLHQLVALAGGWSTRAALRRPAYDSDALRRARRQLLPLNRLRALLAKDAGHAPGCWPRTWLLQIDLLKATGLDLPVDSVSELTDAVLAKIQALRVEINRINLEMRRARHARWKGGLTALWRERPGVVYNWLHANSAPWGTTPILDEAGMQCLSVAAVDAAAVQGYWVNSVLRQHTSFDGNAKWTTVLASPFAEHSTAVLTWLCTPWTATQVGRCCSRCARQLRQACWASPSRFGVASRRSGWRRSPGC